MAVPSKPVRGRVRGRNHRLPDDEYEALLAQQGGGCAVCGATPKTRRLDTDRDHKTGLVRGLLCHQDNRMLPAWMTPTRLRKLADYLERSHG